MPRKEYSDIAAETQLVGNLAIGGLSLTLASATGYPSGTYQFVIKVDDELMLCDGRSGTTVTINSLGRGFSGTTAIAHTTGAPVSHPWESHSATDFQRHLYDVTHDDHTQYQKESERNQNNGYAGLDSSGVVPAARVDNSIARDSEVTSSIASAISDQAVVTAAALAAHEADALNVHGINYTGDLIASDSPRLHEAGDMKASARSTPSEGWLLCDGAAHNRTTQAGLFAAIGTTYGAGNGTTTFNVPDCRGRTVIGAGAGAGLTSRAAGASGGSETHLLVTSEMPTHTHVQDSHNHTQNSHNHTQNSHVHSMNDSYNDFANGIARVYGLGHQALGRDDVFLSNAATAVNIAATATNVAATGTNQNAGNDIAHNNMQPWVACNVFIKT